MSSLGIFNCRKIAGSPDWSVHAEGRAVDLEVGWPPSEVGNELLAAITAAAPELGVQRVIFNGWIHDVYDPHGRPFDDGGAHSTHLHVEQSWAGAHDLDQAAATVALTWRNVREDETLILIRPLDHPESQSYWLLHGGRRIHLANFTNVTALRDGGAVVISLPDATLALLPVLG